MHAPFDQLGDSDAFEQLCFDILQAEGFSDISWRGPGADGGRDIEAQWTTADPAGGLLCTRWYVECKWYTDSVPFAVIEPKLLAASAAGVDYLLIMTSSRVRNTAMDDVATWLQGRGHPFRVRYWTGRDLLRFVVKHGEVFRRHFPALPPPSWGDAAAEMNRLRALASSSMDRLSWRLLPALQWVACELESLSPKSPREIGVVLAEIDLASCMLRAHELFSSSTVVRPSARDVDLAATLRTAVDCASRRFPPVTIVREDACIAPMSRPMVASVLFELLVNASQFASGGPATVSLVVSPQHWAVEIRNPCAEHMPVQWPQRRYRSEGAQKRYPSGQGLGCWLAAEAADAASLRLSWAASGGQWIACLEGSKP